MSTQDPAMTIAKAILATQRTRYVGQPERLDETLARAYVERCEEVEAARAEVAAMRQRVEDLEMIARWLTEDGRQLRRHETVGGFWCSLDDLREHRVLLCAADSTGLPLLTDEARKALRGEK